MPKDSKEKSNTFQKWSKVAEKIVPYWGISKAIADAIQDQAWKVQKHFLKQAGRTNGKFPYGAIPDGI